VLELVNRSPYAATAFSVLDPHAQMLEVLIVRATYLFSGTSTPDLAVDQGEIPLVDEYFGDPEQSSVRVEAEAAWEKPLVDIIVNATAYAPHGKPARELVAGFRLGQLQKVVRVCGDRAWLPGPTLPRPSVPDTFTTMPIIYERSFGGTGLSGLDGKSWVCDPRNPVGVGFNAVAAADPAIRTQVPNVEKLGSPIRSPLDRGSLSGFGVIGRFWEPRRVLAGTYDAAWASDQCPLLPQDFDVRFFQTAPFDQQLDRLKGGEVAEFRNLSEDGFRRTTLPVFAPRVSFWSGPRAIERELRPDTVVFEPDRSCFTITARSFMVAEPDRRPIDTIVVGDLSRGWRRARYVGKPYIAKGTDLDIDDTEPMFD
jgi:hypothetical protein